MVVEARQQQPVTPLSPSQERKLMDYLEDKFLDVTRNYKKRFVFFGVA